MNIKTITKDFCPPIVLRSVRGLRQKLRRVRHPHRKGGPPQNQELEIYWDPKFAEALETWGEDTAWTEIQLLLSHCRGKVLDIACGTGKVIEINSRFSQIDLHGCDISEFLIGKAIERGISKEKLRICDATATGFSDGAFDYAYSIGSLEHFTEPGISSFLQESARIIRNASFHHIPVSRSGKDEGWITPYQSYFNNSVTWWLTKFEAAYATVYSLGSSWEDDWSHGRWFVCIKRSPH